LNGGTLEYSATSLVTSQITQQQAIENQKASIGNLILGDSSATGCITIEEIQGLYRSGSNLDISVGRYVLFPTGINAKFSHKLPVIINGEEYNILLAEDAT
jgi:hypothetical protein